MANSEDSLVDELRKGLEKRRPLAFIYKLHGGPFQPGLPDLLIGMERTAALVEAKWAQDADFDRPLLEACASKLSDKQAATLGSLGMLDGPLRARVLIGGAVEADDLPGGAGVVCAAFDVADLTALREYPTLTLLEIAAYLLDRRRGEKPTLGCAHLIQTQLRARGDEWHAGHLLLGTRYFGPMKASTDQEKAFEDA